MVQCHLSFVYTPLKWSNSCISNNSVKHLFAHCLDVKQFYLSHRWDPIRCYHSKWSREQWQWRQTPHSPNLQSWGLVIRLFNVISRTLLVGCLILWQRCSRRILLPQQTKLFEKHSKDNCLHGGYTKQIRIFLTLKSFFVAVGWLVGWLVGFYGISTFLSYLTPNPFLCEWPLLFQTIQFSMSNTV